MNTNKFCSLELAQQLKAKGFDLPCEYIYANHYRVKDEILEQYPGLSDDGYKELTEEWGGSLREDEVYDTYIEPIREYALNSWVDILDYKICTMPTLDDARTWLRDTHRFHIVVTPEADIYKAVLMLPNKFGLVGCVGGSSILIYNPVYHPSHVKATDFETYEDALLAALTEAMKYIDKWNIE